ncbi:MAG TPA: peptidylprolyl isomerase [Stellaceae bacterium]|nr:peptidylprolyl isomerase [Stellaceae bacterium]
MNWLFAILFLLAAAGTAPAQESRIAAVVNADIVTDGDLAARLRLVETSSNIPDTPDNRQHLIPEVLRTLIDEKLQLQDAKHIGITVPQAEVDKAIGNIERRNNMQAGALDAFFKDRGVAKSTLVDQVTASIAFSKVVQARVAQDVQVSDDQVDETMKRIQADIGKPQSRVAEIFLAVDNPSQEDQVRQLADRLIEQIRGGANFAAVAQQFSQSPSAAVAGDIGWVTPSELSPRLAEAIEKMSPGQMSFPIRTPAGFYLLYLMERRTQGAASPDQISLSLVEVVFPVAEGASPDERKKAEADAQQVARDVKSCGELAKIGAQRAPQLSRQIPQIKASDLPADQVQQILALKVAETSKPMVMPGGIGVVMVCQRQDPPGLPSRDQLSETLAHERLDALARRYMRDLRRGAYVDIRE